MRCKDLQYSIVQDNHLAPAITTLETIAAGALRNAFQHAQARHIEVEIRYDNEQFRLRVQDDGKGIDPAVLAKQARAGHYGLPGMRERAKLAGGNLTVWNKVGAGAEVELTVPAATAYTGSGRRSWFSRTVAGNRR
ncbi:MAG: ATP-binding protein [Silvibacterium sp.]